MDLEQNSQKVKEFLELIKKMYCSWADKIRGIIESKGLPFEQTCTLDGMECVVSFQTHYTSGNIYDNVTNKSFTIDNAPSEFYDKLATIMKNIEEQVLSAKKVNSQEKAKAFLESLGTYKNDTFLEVETKDKIVGVNCSFGKWRFYLREKDTPIQITGTGTWPNNPDPTHREEIEYVIKTLDKLIASSDHDWHVVDNNKFRESKNQLQTMFIRSKKGGCPTETINGVSVQYIGNNLSFGGNLLVPDKWRSYNHTIHEKKFIIDNVEALVAYIASCSQRKKSAEAAFFNMNSTLVKRAREIIGDICRIGNATTLGYNIPVDIEITLDGVNISLRKQQYQTAVLMVNGIQLSWPYSGARGVAEAQLLAPVWPQAEKFFCEQLSGIETGIISHTQEVIEKLKSEFAEQLLIVALGCD